MPSEIMQKVGRIGLAENESVDVKPLASVHFSQIGGVIPGQMREKQQPNGNQ